jgi:two-component system nitrogen regulation sensor histidine kinase NtrY
MPPPPQIRAGLSHEGRVVLLALLAGLPGSACALIMLWTGDYAARTQWTLTLLILCAWLGFAMAVRERVVFPLQTLSNLLGGAARGRLFGARPLAPSRRRFGRSDARGEHAGQHAARAAPGRHGSHHPAAHRDARDRRGHLRLRRAPAAATGEPRRRAPAGGSTAERLLGQTAAELRLAACLEGPQQSTLQAVFPGGAGRWGVRRTRIRERGLPLELVVISDLTQALSEQELQAWQRLVRVLGHELNNSLAPIKSIAGSLESILARDRLPEDWREDMRRGLNVITSRSDSLSRFIGAYARLAKLPRPQLQPLSVADCVGRAVSFETRLAVAVEPGPPLTVRGDPDQLEQVLINLLRNATDASLAGAPSGRRGRIGWRRDGAMLEIWVKPTKAPALSGTANLFVPVLYHQAGRLGHRTGAQPADRREPRRSADTGEPRRTARLRRAPAPAGLTWRPACRPIASPPQSRHCAIADGPTPPSRSLPCHPSLSSLSPPPHPARPIAWRFGDTRGPCD